MKITKNPSNFSHLPWTRFVRFCQIRQEAFHAKFENVDILEGNETFCWNRWMNTRTWRLKFGVWKCGGVTNIKIRSFKEKKQNSAVPSRKCKYLKMLKTPLFFLIYGEQKSLDFVMWDRQISVILDLGEQNLEIQRFWQFSISQISFKIHQNSHVVFGESLFSMICISSNIHHIQIKRG